RWAAGCTGGYPKPSSVRFGLLNTPTPAGHLVFTTGGDAGWWGPSGGNEAEHPATVPLPHKWAKFKGLYLHGKRVVLSYTVGSRTVLESPWVESAGGVTAITRGLEVGPSDQLTRLWCCGNCGGRGELVEGELAVMVRQGETLTVVAVVTRETGDGLTVASSGKIIQLDQSSREKSSRCKILIWQGPKKDLPAFLQLVKKTRP